MDCANREFARNSRGEPKLSAQVKGMWPTIRASDGAHGGPNQRDGAVKMWSTPAANDCKNGTLPPAAANWDSLPGDVLRTGNSGQLNPDWVDTMMGFPAGWSEPDCDEPQEMPFPAPMGCEQYEWEPPRVTTNCPNRANRLKADGNAVIPQIPEIFGRLIMAVEGGANP